MAAREANREAAEEWVARAEAALLGNDYARALRLFVKAQNLYPLEGLEAKIQSAQAFEQQHQQQQQQQQQQRRRLTVTVHQCKGLVNKDGLFGKNDVYCVLGVQNEQKRTPRDVAVGTGRAEAVKELMREESPRASRP